MSNGDPTSEALEQMLQLARKLESQLPDTPETEAEEEALFTIRRALAGEQVDAREVVHAKGYLARLEGANTPR